MRRLRRFGRAAGLVVSAGLAGAGQARAAPATTLLYERTLMGLAGARCSLFRPDVLAALTASAAQARGAAIRAGIPLADIDGAAQRATAKADGLPCDSRDLGVAAGRLRQVFDDYAKLRTMSFPGQFADWRADRPHPPASGHAAPALQWVLLQFAPAGSKPTLVGLSVTPGGAPVFTAVSAQGAASGPGSAAATARLVMRDPARAPQPYLDPRRRGLADRLPPRVLDQVFVASDRRQAPGVLLPPGVSQGQAFRFEPQAAQALARLDPREAAMVEFVYPSAKGEGVRTAWIEVGDFAAAQAFLAVRPAPTAAPKAR